MQANGSRDSSGAHHRARRKGPQSALARYYADFSDFHYLFQTSFISNQLFYSTSRHLAPYRNAWEAVPMAPIYSRVPAGAFRFSSRNWRRMNVSRLELNRVGRRAGIMSADVWQVLLPALRPPSRLTLDAELPGLPATAMVIDTAAWSLGPAWVDDGLRRLAIMTEGLCRLLWSRSLPPGLRGCCCPDLRSWLAGSLLVGHPGPGEDCPRLKSRRRPVLFHQITEMRRW